MAGAGVFKREAVVYLFRERKACEGAAVRLRWRHSHDAQLAVVAAFSSEPTLAQVMRNSVAAFSSDETQDHADHDNEDDGEQQSTAHASSLIRGL
jgi:hypothetical protein